MKYILFIFFPYLYLFLLCGINPPKDVNSCIFYNFENDTSSNDEKCCLITNDKKDKTFCYLVNNTEIKENKTIFNNEEYTIECKNETENEKNTDNKQYEPNLGEICVTNTSINITGPKDCIENNEFDKIKYPCCLFRLQNKNIEEGTKNICISLGYISSQDYLTYDKKILDCKINYIKNKFLLIIILLLLFLL